MAASDGQLKTWVSDRLMALVGYSQGVVAQFVVRLARDCASAGDLAARLVEIGGFPSSPDTVAFAEDMFGRVPRNGGGGGDGDGVSEYQRQVQEAAAVAKKQSTFKLLDDEGGVDAGVSASSSTSVRKRFRRKEAVIEDDEASAMHDSGRNVRRRCSPEEDGDGDSGEEEEMDRDQIEKARLERNIRERDAASTRRPMDRKPTKREQDELARRSEAMDRNDDASELRRLSRHAYLQTRKEKKVDELRDEIVDHEFLFPGGFQLSAAEERDMRRKKEVYGLVQDRDKNNDGAGDDYYYRMPEAYDAAANIDQEKRFSVARRRYEEPEARDGKTAKAFTEQEAWEEQQIRKSMLQLGSTDRGRRGDEYELLFDDGVEFVRSSVMAGTVPDDAEAAMDAKATLQDERKTLPVYKLKDDLLKAIDEYQVLIIVGETGSGKTTQIPQYLHEAGYTAKGKKKVACTQPRRVAAMSVAARVAEEMGVKLGHEVGYSVRFEDCTSDKTVIKYMTDGMLLREFLGEPDLGSYSVVVIDEAHERTLSTDILFGLVKDIARFRPDLKLLISSATLNAEKFSDFFDSAPIFRIPGRRFDVAVHYTKAPEADYIDAAIVTVLQLHVTEPAASGDILLFLTGQEEIETVEEILRQRLRVLGGKVAELVICPIYANLPTELQAKIFEPAPEGARKVVLATNIAETSLTIDGIKYVVDPGFCKVKSYNPRTGMESLLVAPVSKASAEQRAGRSGRTGPGKCFRLYTEYNFLNDLDADTVPEIQRSNLANVVLALKTLGINDLVGFDFMDPPAAESLLKALEELFALGALNSRGELTKTGRRMAEFPLDPMLSKAIVASEKYGCSEEVITIAAMLSAGNAVFYRPKDKQVHADAARRAFHAAGNVGDHVALLNVYNAWRESGYSAQWCRESFVQHRTMRRARDVRGQLVALLERVEIAPCSAAGDLGAVRKAITAGYFRHAARLQRDGSYRAVKSRQTVFVHPSSGVAQAPPRWVVYHELVLTTKEYMRQVTELKPEWLVEIAPHYYERKDVDEPEVKKMTSTATGQEKTTTGATPTKHTPNLNSFFDV
uniref:RNA helicase n=1 Tax=Leersia perrieri TaxID=77586 RepID=A0A0D9WG40_9ORYZ